MSLPYAEQLGHFWRTSSTSPDKWLDNTVKLIKGHGGKVLQCLTGQDYETGKSAFLLLFQFGDDIFRVSWPVLPTRTKDERSAKIQAATLLHHCVKSKLMESKILGTRTAFFSYMMLPDGRTASEAAAPQIADIFPAYKRLESGDVIEGEYKE